MAYAGVAIGNLDALMAKARTEPLLADAIHDMLDAIGEATEKNAEDRAPVGIGPGSHGSIPAAISHYLDPQPIPLQVAIEVAPLEHDGFRYPWALDKAKSWTHRARAGARAGRRGKFTNYRISASVQGAYHYRDPKRGRRSTRNWFTGALNYRQVAGALEKGARMIESKWSS